MGLVGARLRDDGTPPHDRLGPIDRLRERAAARAAMGVRRQLMVRERTGDGGLLDLASNDYLGLCGDARVTAGAVAAAVEWGTGSTGSRLVTGTTSLHAELEEALASFTGAVSALVFSSGYLANIGVVTALAAALASPADPSVLIVSDERNHASLIDACRLAKAQRARVAVTPHKDVAAVRRALAERAEPAALVVSDAVFSVDGTLAPVAELHAAAREHGALLVLDEAHALGVYGPGGRGTAFAAGLAAEPDLIRTVTLSKSLASQGGAVLGAPEVIGTLIDTGRSFIFDTGLAPPSAGAALAALAALRDDPGLPGRARDAAARLAAIAADLGLDPVTPDAAVLAVTLGAPQAAVEAREICRKNGVRAGCFRPPSVPDGQACLRLTARADLTEREFTIAVRALTSVRDHVRVDVSLLLRQ
jgi:8-amino-7-oxononanoate synthase